MGVEKEGIFPGLEEAITTGYTTRSYPLWEYRTMLDVETSLAPGESPTYRMNFWEGALNKMGQEGWELTAVHGETLIFKRLLKV